MNSELTAAVSSFKSNTTAVQQLLDFDQVVLDLAIKQLETLHHKTKAQWAKALKRLGDISEKADDPELSPALSVQRTIDLMRGIRQHGSLKPQYEVMINQALVLLVSYFGSGVRDLARAAVRQSFASGFNEALLRFEIKTTVDQLKDLDRPIEDFIADQVVDAPDVSFQDMKSIGRFWATYFGIEHTRDATLNDIIAGQACRHAIVHSGLIADARLIGQVRNARPRSVKTDLKLGDRIQFTAAEVLRVEQAMTKYIEDAAAGVSAALHRDERLKGTVGG